MLGRTTKKPPLENDYKRRDWGEVRARADGPLQARRYGESRSAWEARRPGQAMNAGAAPYVPHAPYVPPNFVREPGKPFALRVLVRMKNKDLVHVFADLKTDQTFMSLRELTKRTFPTFGRRLTAVEWHADGARVPPAFRAGRLTTLEQCGLATARRVEVSVVYGRTNDRPVDAPPDEILATVATDLRRFGPLALAGGTKDVKVFLEEKATGRRVKELVRDAAGTAGDLDLATEDGCAVPDDAQLRRDVDVDDRLFAYRRQRVAAAFGQLPGSATPFRAPPAATWADLERIVRDAGPPLPRACAFFACEPVASDDVGVQLRTTRRLDADAAAPAAELLGCDRALIGVVAVPLPTARSPPPDSEGAGTDSVCRCVVHLAADEGATLRLERVLDDDGADGAWALAEDQEDDAWALAENQPLFDMDFSREQSRAIARPERYTRDELEALNLCGHLSSVIDEGKTRDVPGACTYDAESGLLTFRPSLKLETQTRYRCVVQAGRHDYVTRLAGCWCFETGEGLQATGTAYAGLVERLRGPDETFDDESRSTWTQKAHANAALMKPFVAKPAEEDDDEYEGGPLTKNKARRMRRRLLQREDELRALTAASSAKVALLVAETTHLRDEQLDDLARLRGEKLDDLDVEALGVLLSTLDAARTKVEAARQRKIENRVPDDYVCAISQEIMVDPCVCADGHSYERTAIAAWLETHDTSPQTNLPLEHKYLVPNITLKKAIAQFQSRTQLEEVSVPSPLPSPSPSPPPEVTPAPAESQASAFWGSATGAMPTSPAPTPPAFEARLAAEGLDARHVGILRDQGITDLETLAMLDQEDLKELELATGPRVKVLRLIKALRNE